MAASGKGPRALRSACLNLPRRRNPTSSENKEQNARGALSGHVIICPKHTATPNAFPTSESNSLALMMTLSDM